MNNIQYSPYIPSTSTYAQSPYKFQSYPIQKCPGCTDNKKSYQIITTNDGNKTQKCTTCGWKWTANK
jgi:DNA-directed RNA polymerase subunit M/transcription elongation factor TFIIS